MIKSLLLTGVLLLAAEHAEVARTVVNWGGDYNIVHLDLFGSTTPIKVKLNGREVSALLDSGSPYSSLTEKGGAKLGVQRSNKAVIHTEKHAPEIQPVTLPDLIRYSDGIRLAPTAPNILSTNMPAPEPKIGTRIRPKSAYYDIFWGSIFYSRIGS